MKNEGREDYNLFEQVEELHGDIRVELGKVAAVLQELEGGEDCIQENKGLCDLVRSCRQEFKAVVLGLEVRDIALNVEI